MQGNRGGRGSRSLIVRDDHVSAKKTYILARLWKYLSSYKWLLALAICMTASSNMLALQGPKLSGDAINAIGTQAGGVDFPTVFKYAGLMIAFYITSSVLSYALSFIMLKLSRGVVYRMRRDLFAKLATLPVGFFDRHQTGEIISILSYDIDTVNASLSSDLVQVLNSIITVVGALVLMIGIERRLILVFVVTIPLSMALTRYMAKRARPLYRKRSATLGAMNGFVEEMIGGLRTTRAYHREQKIIDRFDVKNSEAVDAYFQADYFSSKTGPSVNFINNLSLALVMVFGGLMFMRGELLLGNLSSFILYSRKFSGPINEFANIIAELQSAFAAAERVFRLIDELPEPADAADAVALSHVVGDVRLSNVAFGYDPNRLILKDLSLHAPPGGVIAIVGPTGAGKTTIINLLMRFYDVNSGNISVDGCDIRNITRGSLRLAYTMVLQDTWLFYGTIFENIAYGKENVTLEEVRAAARAAKIDSFIESLPDGYDTVLSDNAVNISKGQKQLLTIARAMLLDSHMLILDEATSNVDTQTERRIQSAMLKLMKDRTCFVIAHRLSTIRNADMILVVRGGDVVERGTHDALMAQGGFYAELYRSQFDTGLADGEFAG